MLNIVIDTNVLFEGLTKRGSVAELLVNAWLVGRLSVYVSTALTFMAQSITWSSPGSGEAGRQL